MTDRNVLILKQLISIAHSSGASDAKVIDPNDICIENDLADFCDPTECEHYALAPSCPPHVSGPSGFRRLQKSATHALVIRISVPTTTLFSDERRDIMRRLHQITAEVEQAAMKAGYPASKAFAGGSCKTIFCYDRTACRVLSKEAECCYPQYARPSMSGFGINVSKLMKTCGWPSDHTIRRSGTDPDSMSWVAGLVLIG